MSEDYEKGTLHTLFELLTPVILLLPGMVALFPYFTRPIDTSQGESIWVFTTAGIEHVSGVFSYLLADPWLALMTLPSVVYLFVVMLRGPKI